jgi:hypothetical protein
LIQEKNLRVLRAAFCLVALALGQADARTPAHKATLVGGERYVGPGDVLTAAGSPPVAAHSMWRRMLASYAGPLFQVELPSGAAQDIGSLSSGYVNMALLNAFCGVNNANGCTVSIIYDQTGNGNVLPQAARAKQAPLAFSFFSAAFPAVPYVSITPGQFYRNRRNVSLIPTGANPTTEYMIVRTGHASTCCGTYGNMEATVADTGNGHMFAVAYSTGAEGVEGSGLGPWPGVDFENGVYGYGAPPVGSYVTVLAKYRGSRLNSWQLKSSHPSDARFTTLHDSVPPYPLHMEGGLSLGEGGDASPAPVNFFEGAILASATSDATDDALQANIAAGYFSPVNPSISSCLASNLAPGPLNLFNRAGQTGWSLFQADAAVATDPFGSNYGFSLTRTAVAPNAGIASAVVPLSANTPYTVTLYVQATNGAPTFPGVVAQGAGHGGLSYGAAVNTNTGSAFAQTFQNGAPTSVSATRVGNFWKLDMHFTTAANQTGAAIVIYLPVTDGGGALSRSVAIGQSAVFYCPSLTLGSN